MCDTRETRGETVQGHGSSTEVDERRTSVVSSRRVALTRGSRENPVLAFVVVMAVWTVSEFVAKKTKSLLSSLFVASLIFLVGFLTGIFPDDLLASSSLLALAGVVVGFIIVHLGTMISLDDFKKQWKTFLIGASTVLGIGLALWVAGPDLRRAASAAAPPTATPRPLDFVIAGTGALSGGTISVIIVQEAALGVGLTAIAVFPVLIAALQGLIGFPLTSIILRREAARLQRRVPRGQPWPSAEAPEQEAARQRGGCPARSATPPARSSSSASSCSSSLGLNNVTDGILNTFVVALVFGIAAADLRGLQAVGAGRHRLARPDDARDHDPGLRAARHRRARRTSTASRGRCVLVFVFGVAGIAGTSPPWSASCSATASPCRSPSGSPPSTGSRAR